MPVLAVAVGLYLPFELDSSIFLGGVLAWALNRSFQKNGLGKSAIDKASNGGLLIASGLITGEALMGILVALLATFGISITVTEDPIGGSMIGLLLLAFILVYLYRSVHSIGRKE